MERLLLGPGASIPGNDTEIQTNQSFIRVDEHGVSNMKKSFLKRVMDLFFANGMPSSEELSRQYAEMTDVAFGQINPMELTPEARQCYEAESRKRKTRP